MTSNRWGGSRVGVGKEDSEGTIKKRLSFCSAHNEGTEMVEFSPREQR